MRIHFRRAGVAAALAVGLLASSGLVTATSAQTSSANAPEVTVIAEGLKNPRGIAFGPDHALYVAEAGRGGDGPCAEHPALGNACVGRTGSITRLWRGDQERVVRGLPSIGVEGGEALGPHDVAPLGGGNIVVTVGLGADPALRNELGSVGRRLGHLLHANVDGSRSSIADIAGYENRANPDAGPLDSNAFGLLVEGHTAWVTDAGGNHLARVGSDGEVTTTAVFRNRLVEFDGQQIPMHAVPTTVVRGPDGALYVGQLTGFPFPIGGARIFRVVPGERPEVWKRGFTNIIDIAFHDGSLYVLEIAHNSLLAESPEGALIKVGPNGRRSIVVDGLFFPGGFTIGSKGVIYVTNCGVCPDAGEVWRVNP
jgi:hypothetical protein